jgi:hypothetical protein
VDERVWLLPEDAAPASFGETFVIPPATDNDDDDDDDNDDIGGDADAAAADNGGEDGDAVRPMRRASSEWDRAASQLRRVGTCAHSLEEEEEEEEEEEAPLRAVTDVGRRSSVDAPAGDVGADAGADDDEGGAVVPEVAIGGVVPQPAAASPRGLGSLFRAASARRFGRAASLGATSSAGSSTSTGAGAVAAPARARSPPPARPTRPHGEHFNWADDDHSDDD